MSRLLAWLVRGYQLLLSSMIGPSCRFYPSCSNYAIEALQLHGAARGSWLALRRVCRCHPWNAGGTDLVPPPKNSSTTACGCNHT
jgi:putative membrane protein insertion efficiency factor